MPNSDDSKTPPKTDSTYTEQKIQEMEHIASLVIHPGWVVMMMQLDREASEALNELVEVPPHDTDRIEQLQRTIRRFQWFRDTPDTIVRAGQNELELLEQEEAENEEGAYDG